MNFLAAGTDFPSKSSAALMVALFGHANGGLVIRKVTVNRHDETLCDGH